MTFGSLFTGIGGIDLGFERAGMTCKWQVEIDTHANKVLEKHWPNVQRFKDVCLVGKKELSNVDVIAGGFPCQDISSAGKRQGIKGERSGLWSQYIRIVREIMPRFVVVENVSALLFSGMDTVLADLSEAGFDARWQTLSAAMFGAPHRRERVFIVANARSQRLEAHEHQAFSTPEIASQKKKGRCGQWAGERKLSHADENRFRWMPKPGVRRMVDGFSAKLDSHRYKGCGNAVVPQVAEWIGRQIMEAAS